MTDARSNLLALIIDEVGKNGLADRSLRDIAASVGSSHRMLLFHFESRAGLISAIVEIIETGQRLLLEELADQVDGPGELVLALWHSVSAPSQRPFVRLFFECVALTRGADLTTPWLEVVEMVAAKLGAAVDPVELRMGVAVSRGLLIDVLAADDATEATASLERFVELWFPE